MDSSARIVNELSKKIQLSERLVTMRTVTKRHSQSSHSKMTGGSSKELAADQVCTASEFLLCVCVECPLSIYGSIMHVKGWRHRVPLMWLSMTMDTWSIYSMDYCSPAYQISDPKCPMDHYHVYFLFFDILNSMAFWSTNVGESLGKVAVAGTLAKESNIKTTGSNKIYLQ